MNQVLPVALIVDDSMLVRIMIRRALDATRWRVIEAANGAEGIRLARIERPALITLDNDMPVINGLDALRWLVNVLPTARIVIVSAGTDPTTIARAIELGAADYITKPFTVEHLQRRIERITSAMESFRVVHSTLSSDVDRDTAAKTRTNHAG